MLLLNFVRKKRGGKKKKKGKGKKEGKRRQKRNTPIHVQVTILRHGYENRPGCSIFVKSPQVGRGKKKKKKSENKKKG